MCDVYVVNGCVVIRYVVLSFVDVVTSMDVTQSIVNLLFVWIVL